MITVGWFQSNRTGAGNAKILSGRDAVRVTAAERKHLFTLDVASSNVSPSSDAQNEQTQLSHPALILEASSSGRTAGFDPAYRGSNPCTSTKLESI